MATREARSSFCGIARTPIANTHARELSLPLSQTDLEPFQRAYFAAAALCCDHGACALMYVAHLAQKRSPLEHVYRPVIHLIEHIGHLYLLNDLLRTHTRTHIRARTHEENRYTNMRAGGTLSRLHACLDALRRKPLNPHVSVYVWVGGCMCACVCI